MKKVILALCFLLLATSTAFANEKKIIIGATPFPHKAIMLVVKPLLEKEGYTVVLKDFSDYIQPNIALAEGSLTANFFQHEPFLNNFNKEKNLDLVAIARVHIEPLGLYSKKIKSLDELKKGDTIAIPNDPTNGTRALRLMEANGLVTLPEGELVAAKDVIKNPKGLKIMELEAALLPRTMLDVTAAVINTNFASEAGLYPTKDAIVMEPKDSPYTNIVVVRGADKETEAAKALARASNSPEVKHYIETELASKGIVPAF